MGVPAHFHLLSLIVLQKRILLKGISIYIYKYADEYGERVMLSLCKIMIEQNNNINSSILSGKFDPDLILSANHNANNKIQKIMIPLLAGK